MEQESQMIQGTVLAVIYQNPENGYCVLKVRTEQGEQVTVVGTIPMSVVGERLAIVGKWTRHQSFGQQFEAEFLERLMPETTSEILAFLSSRAVKGIGPRTAEKIVGRFGDQSLTVLEQDPMRLTEIPGITEKKAQEMAESFQRQSGIRRLIEFLTMYHLPAQLAVRLYRADGELAQELPGNFCLTDAGDEPRHGPHIGKTDGGTGGGSLGRRLENMPARHIDVTPQGGFYPAFLTEEIHLGMQSAQRQTVEARLLLGSAPKGLA